MFIQGSAELPAPLREDASSILEDFELELERVSATDIVRAGTRITFRGGLFRGPPFRRCIPLHGNWNVLGPAGRGEIEILLDDPHRVRYHFSTVELLLMVTSSGVEKGPNSR
jgi:hypothetical protein